MRITNAIGNLSAAIVSAVARKTTELLRDRSGQVAMIFGIATIPLFVSVGLAVDMAQQSRVQLKLAGTSDAIALAAARSYKDKDIRDSIGEKYLNANLHAEYGPGVKVKDLTVDFNDDDRLVTVRLVADIPTIMMSVAGIDKTTVDIRSVVSYEGEVSQPVSLGMVLDVSGSMDRGDPKKIQTLKTASRRLLDRLDNADPDNVYVRTGLVTYSSGIRNTVRMDWGVGDTVYRVDRLTAGGYTASFRAVRRVGDWLRGNTEQIAHESQPAHHGKEFELKRFMIFMTDGKNETEDRPDGTLEDSRTRGACDTAKAAGVEIYTVAFQAPTRGRALLEYCATNENYYYDATNEEAFLKAFDEIAERLEDSLLPYRRLTRQLPKAGPPPRSFSRGRFRASTAENAQPSPVTASSPEEHFQ